MRSCVSPRIQRCGRRGGPGAAHDGASGTRTDLGKHAAGIKLAPNPRDPLYFETATSLPVDFHSFRRAFSTALAAPAVRDDGVGGAGGTRGAELDASAKDVGGAAKESLAAAGNHLPSHRPKLDLA